MNFWCSRKERNKGTRNWRIFCSLLLPIVLYEHQSIRQEHFWNIINHAIFLYSKAFERQDNVEISQACLFRYSYQHTTIHDVPTYISLFSGSSNEPLYFVKVIEKGTANEDLSDPYGHYIAAGEKYFSGYYMKSVRSRNSNK